MTEIREQRQSDSVEAIAQVYVQSWRSAYRGLLPDALLDGLTTARWTEKLALGGPLQSLVAVENGQIVGTCAYGAARSETMCGWGEIVSLYLLPQWTGRGSAARCSARRSGRSAPQDAEMSISGCLRRMKAHARFMSAAVLRPTAAF